MIITNEVYYREQIKESLQTGVSSIHISYDLWSSPNRYSLLVINAQWVDVNCELETTLLALPEFRYTHSGEHQAELLLRALESYSIASKIGWHTGDNATSNYTTLQHLERLLCAKGIIFISKQRRVRCIAHVINLSLQAFLLASSKEALEAAFAEAAEVEGEELINKFSDVLAESRKRPTLIRVGIPHVWPCIYVAQLTSCNQFSAVLPFPLLQRVFQHCASSMVLPNCSTILISTWTYGEMQ